MPRSQTHCIEEAVHTVLEGTVHKILLETNGEVSMYCTGEQRFRYIMGMNRLSWLLMENRVIR